MTDFSLLGRKSEFPIFQRVVLLVLPALLIEHSAKQLSFNILDIGKFVINSTLTACCAACLTVATLPYDVNCDINCFK